jgi:hypothetical protein
MVFMENRLMAYVYFHKTSNDFQFVSETQQACDWNLEFEVAGATPTQIYELVDGAPSLVGEVDTSNPPPSPAEVALSALRDLRNELLAATDWWANSDLTMTAEQVAYRQALRDITANYSSLDDVVWPIKPA